MRVDFGNALVNAGEPGLILRFGLGVAFIRRLAEPRVAQAIALLPFRHEVLALARQGGKFGIASATRADICASDWAASEPSAHCAV